MESKPQRRGAKVVKAVLDATVQELGRQGFAGLSVEDVATRAGVNKTTVYRRWPTKSELVRAALLAANVATGELPNTGDVYGDLLEHTRGLRDRLASPVGRSIFIALLADDPAVASLAEELRRHGEARMRKILRRAIQRGELPRGLDMDLVGDVIFSQLQFRVLFVREATLSDQFLRKVIDVAIAGATDVAADRSAPSRRKRP